MSLAVLVKTLASQSRVSTLDLGLWLLVSQLMQMFGSGELKGLGSRHARARPGVHSCLLALTGPPLASIQGSESASAWTLIHFPSLFLK